jgi:hypothetical protein
MKHTVWTCDRCGDTVAWTFPTVFIEGRPIPYGGCAHEPEGWYRLADGETVIDVCPDCATPLEREQAEEADNAIPF